MAISYRDRCLVTFLVLFALSPFKRGPVSITVADDPLLPVFEQWMKDYGRLYGSPTEKLQRFQVFKDNYQFVESIKNQHGLTYTVGLNAFADLTNEEFAQRYTTRLGDTPTASTSFRYENVTSIPSSIDWRDRGAVTPVKNQNPCGSCWAFSAVASIEGINQITTGNLISLSEQEIIDCDTISNGCSGGRAINAFNWVIQNGGITTEENYPYTSNATGTANTCDTSKTSDYAANITDYETVPNNNETALAMAVANQPVSLRIDAHGTDFQNRWYTSGIFNGPCGTDQNHAVTAVGYGTTADGTNYWIVKNSWGTSWGDSGYVLMQKDIANSTGLCGLAVGASYPTV